MLLLKLNLLRWIHRLTHRRTLLLFLSRCAAKTALLESSLLWEAALLLTRLQLRLGTALLRLEAHRVVCSRKVWSQRYVVVACALT